jgi:hypothetical protein
MEILFDFDVCIIPTEKVNSIAEVFLFGLPSLFFFSRYKLLNSLIKFVTVAIFISVILLISIVVISNPYYKTAFFILFCFCILLIFIYCELCDVKENIDEKIVDLPSWYIPELLQKKLEKIKSEYPKVVFICQKASIKNFIFVCLGDEKYCVYHF